MMKYKEEHIYYVKIGDSLQLRKNFLESSKDMVELLKRYEELKDVRAEKIEEISKLRSKIKDINKLLSHLKEQFPEIKLKIPREKQTKPQRTQTVKQKQTETPKKEMTELQKLEAELDDIEKKLSSLA